MDQDFVGLTGAEVKRRQAEGLGNVAPPATGRTYWQILAENLFTFINGVIFALGAALWLLGRKPDALVSTGLVAFNIIVSLVQEVRAKWTLDRINLLTRPRARVVREGQEGLLDPQQLVVGDILRIIPGDQVPVDGRLLDGRLAIDESSLTGESRPVNKAVGDSLHSGSYCVSGGGLLQTESVGSDSVVYRLTRGARAFRRVLTPLQREVYLVIQLMVLVVLYLQVVLIVNALLKKLPLPENVQNAAVLMSLVPNGLFLSITLAYALAAVRIVRYGALVQQANAVESLSQVNVLCMDKTGTLTTNRLQLHSLHPDRADLRDTLGAVVASSVTGNSTSQALARALPRRACHPVAEVPFSSIRKWSAVALDDPTIRGTFVLGAPELLMIHLLDPPAGLAETIGNLSSMGLRVLLLCGSDSLDLVDLGDHSQLPQGLTFHVLACLQDELRPDAQETLEAFQGLQVAPKIISGDHPETVSSLARQLGISLSQAVSGAELEKMDAVAFRQTANQATVFGRVTPQQKQALVKVLRDTGHYVAMIGDGVNDVLSLKEANLAIALKSGCSAARGVADLILLDDSFTCLVPALEEGQRIRNGMQSIFKLFLTRIASFALIIITALMVGMFPLEVAQGSFISTLSVGFPSMLLALWAPSGPSPRGGLLLHSLLHFVVPPAILMSLIGLVLFYGSILWSGGLFQLPWAEAFERESFEHAFVTGQTVLSAFITCCGLLLIVFARPPSAWWTGGSELCRDRRPAYLACGLFVCFFATLSVPEARDLLNFELLGPSELMLLASALALWTVLVRLFWRYRLLARFLGVELWGGVVQSRLSGPG